MSEAKSATQQRARDPAYGVNYLKNEWRAVDPAVKADIDFLNANLKGQWEVQSQTRANKSG